MNSNLSAFNKLEGQIQALSNSSELEYFKFHKKRYERVYDFVKNKYKGQTIKILDIGSHFLHTSCLIRSLGHEVVGMDVSEFWSMDFVNQRAQDWGITPLIENNLAFINSLDGQTEKYDLILFTEIFEHITFNPVLFWKKIYQVLDKVTYGHHWKEYNATEIRHYFEALSDDFSVEVRHYHYKNHELKSPNLFFNLLAILGNKTSAFSDELEVIVVINKSRGWKKEVPSYS
jgi:hypothetical protein